MKKIVFFSKNLKIGGMEKALVKLINELSNFFAVTLYLEKKEGVLLKNIDKRVKIKEYKISNSKNKLVRKCINLFKRLMWTITNYHKYDFACNYATYMFNNSRMAQLASKNNCLYVHSNYLRMLNNEKEFINFFEYHKINRFKNIIFVSNESKNDFQKIYPNLSNKLNVINNLFDYNEVIKLSKKDNKININKKYKNFVFIGRLENESKNFDLLLESFKKAIKKDKDIFLYIIGNGPYYKNIKNYIEKNNMKENVNMMGELNNPYSVLKECDSLILTSKYEGFPVVYLESLILNKFIMTTIPTSDSFIDVREYCELLEYDSEKISKKLVEYKKQNNIKNNIDFNNINKKQIEKLIEIIGG